MYASFDKESLNIFDIEVCEQHARARPRRYQSWFVWLLLDNFDWILSLQLAAFDFIILWFLLKIFLLNIVYHVIVLLFNAFNRVLIHLIRSMIRDGFLRDDLIFFVLLVKLDLEIVLFRMNLICKFGFFYNISHKFKLIEEKQELPN